MKGLSKNGRYCCAPLQSGATLRNTSRKQTSGEEESRSSGSYFNSGEDGALLCLESKSERLFHPPLFLLSPLGS